MATNAEAALEILTKSVGNEEGVGEWFTVKQDQINLFADAPYAPQFIHLDPANWKIEDADLVALPSSQWLSVSWQKSCGRCPCQWW